MSVPLPIRPEENPPRYRKAIALLAAGVAISFAVILWQTSFTLKLSPDSNEQLGFLAFLSALIFLLFVALTFVLARNLLKLFAERRLGALGSKFRTRVVVTGLLLSFLPVIVMFWFSYGVMNRSLEKWFSQPVEEVRQDTQAMAVLVSTYAAQNAHAEALSMAASPEVQRAFQGHSFAPVVSEFRAHETTLQGGFAVAMLDGNAEASFGLPAAWAVIKNKLPSVPPDSSAPVYFSWDGTEFIIGSAPVGKRGDIVVAMPLPKQFSDTAKQIEASQKRYIQLAANRKLVRRTYLGYLLLLTMSVLFATTWLALFLSKLVTRPVVALAEATQEISRGRLDYRVDVHAADELGDLVRSFNRMAEELEASRRQIEASSSELSAVNTALEQRRRHIETILESIPTGVLSLDATGRVTHVNYAFIRMFYPVPQEGSAGQKYLGASLEDIFPTELYEDMEHLLRRADRMGSTTTQMEVSMPNIKLNVAITIATLEHGSQRQGYVLVFEDLSDLLKAQKQAAWREVARRVAHEIKNPLTPIALSAERIRRHLANGSADAKSIEIVRSCADTIDGAVDAVRSLVDEFSTLARFPTAQPQPADINSIVENTLVMFNGRLENIAVHTALLPDLPPVMADGEAMKRALANLVDNAAEAMKDSVIRELEISTAMVEGRDAVEITVSDTGHGVTHEMKERLFLPYFSTKKRGTGLGLAIVSRIIEDHRGSIRVEENRPVGAKFVIELPVAVPAGQSTVGARHA